MKIVIAENTNFPGIIMCPYEKRTWHKIELCHNFLLTLYTFLITVVFLVHFEPTCHCDIEELPLVGIDEILKCAIFFSNNTCVDGNF